MDQKWYQDFVADGNMPREMLFDLLTAANYMGIKALLDLTCLKVTFELTGKNAEQVSACHISLLFVVYRTCTGGDRIAVSYSSNVQLKF